MAQQRKASLLGRLAIHAKLITMRQLREATLEQSRQPGKRLGAIMVDKGYLSSKQLERLLELQQRYVEKRRQAGPGRSTPAPLADGTEFLFETDEPAPTDPPESRPGAPPEAGGPPAAGAPPRSLRAGRGASAPGGPPARPVSSRPGRPARSPQGRWLNSILAHACGTRASDVLLHPGAPAKLRRLGQLCNLTDRPLTAAPLEEVLRRCLDTAELSRLDADGAVDCTYAIPEVGRFRAHVYRQHSGLSGIFRCLPPEPPTLDELGLPSTLARLASCPEGLLLLTGPSGCGKTSTAAALIGIINEERTDRIVTIEKPIEHLMPSGGCIVSQRAVGRHARSFSAALQGALQEDADVIFVGELPDPETIYLALNAAETGHLVLATLPTRSAVRTIRYLVDCFPAEQREHGQLSLSRSLRGIISQRLLPTVDGGVAAAHELLQVDRDVAELIRLAHYDELLELMQDDAVTLDDSLHELVTVGEISRRAAAACAVDPSRFEV